MKNLLIAVLPFDTIEIPVVNIADALFKETGFSSTQALPPVIPLCYLPEDINIEDVHHQLLQYRICTELKTSRIIEYNNSFFLSIEPADRLRLYSCQLKQLFKITDDSIIQGMIPLYPGFFLGQKEESTRIELVCDPGPAGFLSKYSLNHQFTFSAFRVCLLKLSSETPQWWLNIHWEILFSVKSLK